MYTLKLVFFVHGFLKSFLLWLKVYIFQKLVYLRVFKYFSSSYSILYSVFECVYLGGHPYMIWNTFTFGLCPFIYCAPKYKINQFFSEDSLLPQRIQNLDILKFIIHTKMPKFLNMIEFLIQFFFKNSNLEDDLFSPLQ